MNSATYLKVSSKKFTCFQVHTLLAVAGEKLSSGVT